MSEPITWTNCKMKLGDLHDWPGNPAEIGKDAAARLVESFNEFGQVQALAIDPDNVLCDGHQRLHVWIDKFGADFVVDCRRSSRKLTERERQKLAVYLRSGAVGKYNWDTLSGWDASDLKEWGFDTQTLREWQTDTGALRAFIEANEEEPKDAEPQIDRAAELLKKWQVKTGDLWMIGGHRLLCGDSTKREDVEKVMGGEKAMLMATDPPYGVAYDNSKRPNPGVAKPRVAKPRVANDEITDGPEMQAFLESMLRAALPNMEDHAAFYFWHPMLTQGTYVAAAAAGILIHRQIIWVKPVMLLGRGDYHWRHELCFYGWQKGNRPPFYGQRNQDTIWEVGSVTQAERKAMGHATPKPVELWDKPICNHTKEGEICFEPFAGSGTQFAACQNRSRKCYGLELDPKYCAVTLERMATAFPGIEIRRVGT